MSEFKFIKELTPEQIENFRNNEKYFVPAIRCLLETAHQNKRIADEILENTNQLKRIADALTKIAQSK